MLGTILAIAGVIFLGLAAFNVPLGRINTLGMGAFLIGIAVFILPFVH